VTAVKGRVRAASVNAFQWLFLPASHAAALLAMTYALSHGLGAQGAVLIPLVVFGLVAIAERLLPFEPDWNRSRGDVLADISSLALVALGLESLFKVVGPVLAVLLLAAMKLPADWYIFPRNWPFWAQCMLVIGFIELTKYWFHRLGHESKFWWPLHSVHHAVKRVYLLNGFRIHPLYHLITYVIGYFPCVLLGAPAETLLVHNVVLGVAGAFQHGNISLKHGVLNYIFSTNEIHRWHHSNKLEEGNRNYGAILSIFDVIFGTYHNVPGKSPETIGMVKEEGYPIHSYLGQLLIPFTYHRLVKSGPSHEQ